MKYIIAQTYKPLLVRYLSRTRSYAYKGIVLEIPPEVFHPGFFNSTKVLLRYINGLKLENRSLLELGAGSGLIGFSAAKKGAVCTLTDINPVAIRYLNMNAARNQLKVEIIQSDLFAQIPETRFDIIAINPPYYKKPPRNNRELAWYCGSKGEYFQNLFMGLHKCMHEKAIALMVLCNECDVEMIKEYASIYNCKMEMVESRSNIVGKNFIYKLVYGN